MSGRHVWILQTVSLKIVGQKRQLVVIRLKMVGKSIFFGLHHVFQESKFSCLHVETRRPCTTQLKLKKQTKNKNRKPGKQSTEAE